MQKNLTQKFWNTLYKKSIVFLLIMTTLFSSTKAQYCTTSVVSLSELIGNVNFAGINNTSTVSIGYEDFTAVSGSIFQGATAPITITLANPFAQDQVIVWIDFNNNGTLNDPGEQVFISAIGGGPFTGTITVPAATAAGPKRMRIRLHDTSSGPNTTPCGAANWGQVEDYTVNVLANVPCAGTPVPGNTVSTVATACFGSPFTLSLQNTTAGTGVTYQWQSATTAAGPWTAIAGATNMTYVGSMTTALFYRCVVTCGANAGNSNPLQVALTPASGCYCANTATSTADEDIFNVTLGTLNNSSTCTTIAPGPGSAAALYSNYTSGTGAPAAPDLIAGGANPISIQIGTCGGNFSNFTAVWIDYNQNGAFEAAERLYVSPAATTGPHLEIGSVTIPASALLGITRMRVQVREFGTAATMLPCSNMTWGEVEDYNVNIIPCVPLAISIQPASATAVCGGNVTFTTAATGSIPTYAWQYRTSATGAWLNVPNAAPYTNVNTAALTVASNSSLNGYQYRASVSGACTAIDFSSIATLTVTPLVLNVTPASGSYCLVGGTPVLLTVPNSSQTVTFNSSLGAGLGIPDGPATAGVPVPGVNTGLTVSGIPVGATILDISVKLNITHPYAGDLIVSLKSPTSTATTGIINLFALLNGGAGTNATANFTNTVISSNGVTALSGAPAPRTGTFKADAYILTSPPLTIALPSNGGAANVNNWSTLLSTPNANGSWVLYLADAGATDIGTLLDWSISITYGSAPATAIFTPSTGLFTNAAGTTPYTGTAVGQVYAAPTATTTYSAVVTAGLCSTNPQSITINANTAPAGTLIAAPVTVCNNKPAVFGFTGLSGGTGLNYQWQVSTTAVPTFTNIAGATTAGFTIPSATTALSGNKYRVIVSSAGCAGTTALTSSESLLTVNPTPIVTISVSPFTKLFPGLTTTLTASVSPTTASTYQWVRNGANVAGATTNKYVANIDGLGTYTVNVSDANGCTNTSTIPSSISITDSATNNILFIYPSPNSGKFQVRYYFADNFTNNTSSAFVNVYDEKGVRVFTRQFTPGKGYGQMNVDLGAHGTGVYRVDLLNANGERLKTGSALVF
jgi:subtilisin-like proprotein convertase family protein